MAIKPAKTSISNIKHQKIPEDFPFVSNARFPTNSKKGKESYAHLWAGGEISQIHFLYDFPPGHKG